MATGRHAWLPGVPKGQALPVNEMVFLAGSLTQTGGMERFNRLFSRALGEYCSLHGGRLTVLALADQAVPEEAADAMVEVRCFAGNRARFAQAAMDSAFRSELLVVGLSNFMPLALPMIAAARLRRRPRIALVVHGVEAWVRWGWLSRLAGRSLDCLLSVSQHTADRCTQINDLKHVPVKICPNALDPSFQPYLATPAAVDEVDGPALLTVTRLGSFGEYKGVDTVIQALPAILTSCPGAHYAVIGDGHLVPRLRALAESLGVVGQVEFRGRVSHEDLVRAYRECSVFVMPSAGEGFGVVYLEAMAFGRPVVAASAGGAPEVVSDGATGLLVPYGDAAVLADTLTRLLRDPSLRHMMGAAGRARVAELFTYDRFRARVWETVDSVLRPGVRS